MTDRRKPGDRDDERFLARWSRRKRHGGAAPATPEAPIAPEAPATPEAPVAPAMAAGEGDLPVLAETTAGPANDENGDELPADLPAVESLGRHSDYTVFMRQGVPEALRRQALRKLWRSDPLLANLDGLNDYDENFAACFSAAITKTVKTAYRVGKGFATDDDDAPASPETAAAAPAHPGTGGDDITIADDGDDEGRDDDEDRGDG